MERITHTIMTRRTLSPGKTTFRTTCPAAGSTGRRNGVLNGKSINAWPIGTNCAASGWKKTPETPVRAVTGKSLLFRKNGNPHDASAGHTATSAIPCPGDRRMRTYLAPVPSGHIAVSSVPSLQQNGFNVLPAISVPADLNRGSRPLPASGCLHLHPVQAEFKLHVQLPPRRFVFHGRMPCRNIVTVGSLHRLLKSGGSGTGPQYSQIGFLSGFGPSVPRQLDIPLLCAKTLVGPFPRFRAPARYVSRSIRQTIWRLSPFNPGEDALITVFPA